MNNHKLKIIIVGGGTAGWMAANLMAKRWATRPIDILLIESTEIGILGVGEGSTPQLKGFFDSLGIEESEWMPKCNATYKNGITFNGWSSKPEFENYFHPFPAKTDNQTAQAFVYNCYLRRNNINIDAHPDKYFLPAYLAHNNFGPKPNYNFPFEISYGYHFDSYLMSEFLQGHGKKNGVLHRQEKISQVKKNNVGDIESIITEDGEVLTADFFIDSTGFSGLLIQKSLGIPFVSFSDNLFNDAAVVLPTEKSIEPNSKTISTAMKYGWAWDIPLTNRNGNGYVYSSVFCSADDAELELRRKLNLKEKDISAKHLKMKVGRVTKHWHRNCLAVGLSQGFIEPLEATALHLVQDTIERFIDAFEEGSFSNKFEDRFNMIINKRFEGIRDYIVCHYRINSRRDTDYWKENASNPNISESLKNILNIWTRGEDLSVEIHRQDIEKYYSSVSWHCMLSGYGVYPNKAGLIEDKKRSDRFNLSNIIEFNRRCALNFRLHSEQLTF